MSPRRLPAHPRCAAGSPVPRALGHGTITPLARFTLLFCYSGTSRAFSDPALIENIPLRNGRERENLYTKFTAPACASLSPRPSPCRRQQGEGQGSAGTAKGECQPRPGDSRRRGHGAQLSRTVALAGDG